MKKTKTDNKDFYIESYRQFIILTLGEDALNTINSYIENELSKPTVETPEKYNKAILEMAILNNV